MKEKWYFIDSGDKNPYYNMALDEKLMDWHREGKIPPAVRFYGWNPATLSVGYFQKAKKEIDMDAVNRHGLGFVRRPTGGRAVLHEDELTYSVIVSEDHPQMPDTVTEAYRVISQGLLEGFLELGLDAGFSIPRTEEERNNLKNPRSAVCFDASSWYELVVEGRKIAGSAQTRQKGVILQHGSIILSLNEDKLFDVFNYPNDRVRERMQRSFKNKAVAIEELLGKKVPVEKAKKVFKEGFEKGLNVRLEHIVLSDEQEKEVQVLAYRKYGTDDWNYKS
ncbi:lipoate--protein ligase family protein [Bacillus sp. H-16]|uniref:lipoate--protein ligase family protein n=1 Tax=Alteribacter salitolerans TaxID=2912333 RepID=UPI001965D6D5|nr:biotin/lipoate A/B protein ligase family protein [Alteribacter salitolerans]MBM7097306.1 lipoate--protein ligase family protein [Alteribacter salitolerans]